MYVPSVAMNCLTVKQSLPIIPHGLHSLTQSRMAVLLRLDQRLNLSCLAMLQRKRFPVGTAKQSLVINDKMDDLQTTSSDFESSLQHCSLFLTNRMNKAGLQKIKHLIRIYLINVIYHCSHNYMHP